MIPEHVTNYDCKIKTEFVAVKWGLASCAPFFGSVSIIMATASYIKEKRKPHMSWKCKKDKRVTSVRG